ncbi:hypothetical protein Scep_014002 [Stephania cephalantha]|uniref:Uncharacterized protein n=1 Tax=Stephania cephalantha TaxID=152367 RepID=A0AAP0P2K3_9MAGN
MQKTHSTIKYAMSAPELAKEPAGRGGSGGARGGASRQRRTMAGAAPAAEQPRTRAAANQPQAAIGPAARRWTAGAPAGEDDGLVGSGVARTAQRGGVDQRRLQIWRELARLRGADGDRRRRRRQRRRQAAAPARQRRRGKRFGSTVMARERGDATQRGGTAVGSGRGGGRRGRRAAPAGGGAAAPTARWRVVDRSDARFRRNRDDAMERVRAGRQGPRPKSDVFHGRPSIFSGSMDGS